ncbi:hypothetical protein C8R47DRAFT_1295358 [Mycena vitilis]|nr:hypothetical protein C8R47DRAFT_1295358 [Mycena vitilis]
MPSLRGRTFISSDDPFDSTAGPTDDPESTDPILVPGQSVESAARSRASPGQIGIWGSPAASGPSLPATPTRAPRVLLSETLPGSSPILSSPDGPAEGSWPLPLPPLSSDGLLYTSPIKGTKEQRKAIAYAKGVKKREVTLAANAAEEPTKEELMDEILDQLAESSLSFGDLMLYVFDPIYKQGDIRWRGFFRSPGLATRILDFWVSKENSETARTEVDVWAVEYVAERVRREAKEITESKVLQTGGAVNGDYVDGFSMRKMGDYLRTHAKTVMTVLDAFALLLLHPLATSGVIFPVVLPNVPCALTLLGEYSYRNNFSRRIMSLYFYASGAQRQTISVLSHLGLSESYQNLVKKTTYLINRRARAVDPDDPIPSRPSITPAESENLSTPPDPVALGAAISAMRSARTGTLRQLSGSMRDMARAVAATGLYGASYDNINMVFRAAEQVLGKTDSQENGTCTTIWPLWKAALDDMKIKDLYAAFDKAPPLTVKDILLTASESVLMDKCVRHCILRIIVEHGGEKFDKFRAALDETLPARVTEDKIELHKTPLHPLPAWNIDQSSIVGNEEVVDAIHDELQVKELSHWQRVVKFFAGDQLTIARLRSLLSIRAGHEGGYSGFGWGVWIPGLFHSKIADMHGFFVTHWGVPHRGTRNPGCLAFHNTHLHRAPITLTSLPPFRTCRDLVFVSLYARVLHCLLLVTDTSTLDACADSVLSFEDLEAHAEAIQNRYANASVISDLRWERKMADDSEEAVPGDEIFENACLFMRDALLSRELTDSIKAGDSGRVVLVLKVLALSYRGNGRTKYAYEMMHLIHNLTHVWPPSIRIVLNNWLLNPTGHPYSWVEADLMQEHMNYWIKTIYQAHGSGASWEWLEMVAPCISVLRRLSTSIRQVLGSDQGTKHEPADLQEDITLLMESLAEHDVYKVKGRVFAEGDGSPTPDVVSVGAQQLTDSSSNPLTEYNTMFSRLQSRLRLKPLVGGDPESEPQQSWQLLTAPSIPLVTSLPPAADTPENSEDEDTEANEQPSLEQIMNEEDGPTLTRDTAADVALDMDGGDDGFLFPEDEDDFYIDDGAIDNSEDEYIDD